MLLRYLFILAMALCLTASTAEAAKAKKKKNKGGVRGTVVAVEKDKDSGDATITVKPQARKKKGQPSPGEQADKKIKIGKNTKFELVSGKKGSRETKSGSLDDVKQGGRVMVRGGEANAADSVMVHQGKKKKKKNS